MLSITNSLHSIQTLSLICFCCVSILEWIKVVQSYLQLELWSLTFFTLLHSSTLPTSIPLQCPVLHKLLRNTIRHPHQFPKGTRVHSTVLQVDDTRCLKVMCVTLTIKLKLDITSQLGRQLNKKSLFSYEVRVITVHENTNNKHQQCFIKPGKHDTSSHTSWY